jgi:hypothetical protein
MNSDTVVGRGGRRRNGDCGFNEGSQNKLHRLQLYIIFTEHIFLCVPFIR